MSPLWGDSTRRVHTFPEGTVDRRKPGRKRNGDI
jgi:hypothetical protein